MHFGDAAGVVNIELVTAAMFVAGTVAAHVNLNAGGYFGGANIHDRITEFSAFTTGYGDLGLRYE